ncbi:MAG: response regulator [Chthoniobacterales bacterium]|nr:response regulator [Chthoniobacterales bacterium]
MHSVETAENGREALEKFRQGGFDLIVTDHVMPEMNGEQLAAAIKQLAPEIPVILLTGYADDSFSARSAPDAIDLVLGKPLLRTALRGAIAEVMGRKPGSV